MLKNEAAWLGTKLAELSDEQLGTILNLGSSTADFRRKKQPYVEELIFAPLAERAVRVVHFDVEEDPGVDIVGDIYDDAVLDKLRQLNAHSLICSNLVEHVAERSTFVRRVQELVPSGGYLLVTAPFSFPYHPDPIDTYYRPSPAELSEQFSGFRVLEDAVVENGTYGEVLRNDPKQAVSAICRLAVPFFRPRNWLGCLHRLKWLRQPFKASCVLLKKN